MKLSYIRSKSTLNMHLLRHLVKIFAVMTFPVTKKAKLCVKQCLVDT